MKLRASSAEELKTKTKTTEKKNEREAEERDAEYKMRVFGEKDTGKEDGRGISGKG